MIYLFIPLNFKASPRQNERKKNPMSRTKKHPYIIANPHSWSGVANSVEGNWGGNGKGERNPWSQWDKATGSQEAGLVRIVSS